MKRVYSGVVAAGLCLAMMGSFTGCRLTREIQKRFKTIEKAGIR